MTDGYYIEIYERKGRKKIKGMYHKFDSYTEYDAAIEIMTQQIKTDDEKF
jgi:hypothetical protein